MDSGGSNIGEVEDVANAVLFLASDIATYIHGADLNNDGGYMNNTIPRMI